MGESHAIRHNYSSFAYLFTEDSWVTRSAIWSSIRVTAPRRVEAITERTVRGVTREYLQLSVLSSDGLVINVPVDNVKKVGVRDIVDANEVSKVFEILRTPIIEKEMNWSRPLQAERGEDRHR